MLLLSIILWTALAAQASRQPPLEISRHGGRHCLPKNRYRCGKPVQKIFTAYRSELAGAEKPTRRYLADQLGHEPGVVVRCREKA
jgi:hypothetical protein